MAGDLQAGFSNNRNVIQIRTSGSSMQRVTDRPIDFDGDGNNEQVTVSNGVAVTNTANGNKMKPPVVVSRETGSLLDGTNQGVARSVIQRIFETDRGINTEGSEYTEGIE